MCPAKKGEARKESERPKHARLRPYKSHLFRTVYHVKKKNKRMRQNALITILAVVKECSKSKKKKTPERYAMSLDPELSCLTHHHLKRR
jgi:hypothetical protein